MLCETWLPLIFRAALHHGGQCHIVDRKMGSSKREFYPEKPSRLQGPLAAKMCWRDLEEVLVLTPVQIFNEIGKCSSMPAPARINVFPAHETSSPSPMGQVLTLSAGTPSALPQRVVLYK